MSPGVVSYTVCTASHLPFAKALGDSLIQHNPDHAFRICLLDRRPEVDDRAFLPHQIFDAESTGLDEFRDMNARLTVFELSCAMKAQAAQHVFATDAGCNKLFYVDSDVRVFGSMARAEAALDAHPVLLTPHLVSAVEFDGRAEVETLLLPSGFLNGGIVGLRRGDESRRFLEWWAARTRTLSGRPQLRGLLVEQMLLSFVPTMFPGTGLLRDPGFNVAYWNLGERRVSRRGGRWLVNDGDPLVSFHFSGYDIRRPERLTRHLDIYTFENRPECVPLFEEYRRAVLGCDPQGLLDLKPSCGVEPRPERPSPWKGAWARLTGRWRTAG